MTTLRLIQTRRSQYLLRIDGDGDPAVLYSVRAGGTRFSPTMIRRAKIEAAYIEQAGGTSKIEELRP